MKRKKRDFSYISLGFRSLRKGTRYFLFFLVSFVEKLCNINLFYVTMFQQNFTSIMVVRYFLVLKEMYSGNRETLGNVDGYI